MGLWSRHSIDHLAQNACRPISQSILVIAAFRLPASPSGDVLSVQSDALRYTTSTSLSYAS